jgi:hypothetical protein
MDELLTRFSEEQLLSELEQGHYWYCDGIFCSGGEKMRFESPISVEYAAYYRFYN